MDNLVGTLIYKITGDTSSLDRNLRSSSEKMNRTGKSLERLGQQAKRVATSFISAYLVKSLVDAASNLEELDNKFKVVFDGVVKESNNWAKVYAAATNRGVTATKTFLAMQQDIRTGFGADTKEAAKFSQAVMGVVNDLSSFSNVKFDEASAAIQSGLSGQFIALRRLGVGLNVNIINQGAYAKALNKTWDEMSNLERQEAILSGIMNQSRNAIGQTIDNWKDYNYELGDAVRTSDRFANSQKGLAQKFEDLKGALGQALLPAATSIVHVLEGAIDSFNSLPGIIQATSVALGILAVSIKALSGPVGWVVGGVTALVTLLGYAKTHSKNLTKITDELSDATKKYNDIVVQLNDDTEKLSKADKILLENKKELLKIEMEQKALKLSESYIDEINYIDKLNSKLEELEYDKKNILMHLNESPNNITFLENLKETETNIKNLKTEINSFKLNFESSMVKIAKAAKDGLVDIEAYKNINIDFYNELQDTINNLGTLEGNNANLFERTQESIDKIRVATSEYKEVLEELYIEKVDKELEDLKNAKDYEAYNKRKIELIKQEKRVALERLAVDSNLVKSSENVKDLTISDLTARLSRFKDTREATVLINQITNEQLIAQNKEYNSLIEEANNEALEKEKKRIEDLNKAKEEALANAIVRLENQSRLMKENISIEFENLGDINKAYEIKNQILNNSLNKEIEAYNKRKEKGKATEEELFKIKEYYAIEEEKLNKEKELKIAQAEDEALEKTKQKFLNAFEHIKGFIQSFGNSVNTIYQNMTNAQISEIDKQTQAKLEALGLADETQEEKLEKEYKEAVKKGDMKLAKEKLRQKEKLRLEKEADDQKKKLQREQAKRERDSSIFSATVNTAAAIIKAMVKPGGWAGLGLSVLAGAMGAAQIAAIASQPLPSFAVGTANVPEDMIANIHKGETIIPRPFAEDVRKGKISIGDNSAKTIINIINNTNAKVSATSSTENNIEKIQVLVEETVNGGISDGKFDDSFESSFGITRRGLNA